MPFIARILVLLLLAAVGVGAFMGIYWLINAYFHPVFLVRPFEVLNAAGEKNNGKLFSKLLTARMRDIDRVLASKLQTADGQRVVLADSMVTAGFAPTVAQPLDIEIKAGEFDIAGVVQKTVDLFHTGPVLEGALLNSGKGAELAVHYEEKSYEQDWVQPLERGAEPGINELAHRIILTLHQRNAPALTDFSPSEFRAYVSGLQEYQMYVQTQNAGSEAQSDTHLTAAIDFWSGAVRAGAKSPRLHIYLASACVLAGKFAEAEQALNSAIAAGSNDEVVRRKAPGLKVAIANSNVPAPIPRTNAPNVNPVLVQPAAKLIHLSEAFQNAKGQPVTIAILGTGFSTTKQDRVLEGKSFVPGEGMEDYHENGTKLGQLVLSLAPMARLLPIKVLSSRNGTGGDGQILEGLNYAAESKVQVVLMTFGSAGRGSSVYQRVVQVLEQRGILVVAPAGNSGTDEKTSPAESGNILSVASTTADGKLSPYTTYGSWVQIAAPGEHFIYLDEKGELVDSGQGTGNAAAVTAAIAAMVRSTDPDLPPAEVTKLLKRTASPLVADGTKRAVSSGVINAGAAVKQALAK